MRRGVRHWVDGHRVAAFWVSLGVTLVTVATLAVSRSGSVLIEAQRAKTLDGFNPDELRRLRVGIVLDYAFMAAYVALGWVTFSLIGDPTDKNKRRHAIAAVGVASVIAAGVADAVEDFLLWRALHASNPRDMLAAMRGVGLVKWGLLFATAAAFLVLLVQRAWRPKPAR